MYFHSTKECKLAIGMEVIADSDVVSSNIIAGLARLDNQQKSSELGGRLSIMCININGWAKICDLKYGQCNKKYTLNFYSHDSDKIVWFEQKKSDCLIEFGKSGWWGKAA